ncbi:malonic semialdehyde reductase [Candidatus Odyssella acanthamoebae]|uniref:Putative NADH dehydrogenase/NAD(P)H nitroreductase ID47_11275 n=1 Tax=Candidatus Odyssella acanthamoebae TaxID=91604 RepID=A0A077AX61_9PROT|nr:malonic semialdehyde reductase [Candidatus Paracaedibacter acanthamoebae]AIK97186.1 malonic semialdehyde reductase [Candidatus Paracaedibacter acanthamoebae]
MINQDALNQLFIEARTHSAWQDKKVSEDTLRQVFDLAKMAPTSANCSPLRLVFVQSQAAKEKLKPCLAPGNIDKTMAAPVTAIIASDMEFYEQLPMLFPHADARSWFVGNQELIEKTAVVNGSLQAAYFILAARACGLDCGPMSGFDNVQVDEAFFKGTSFQSNILCNLGYGEATALFPRSPRFDFADVCRID